MTENYHKWYAQWIGEDFEMLVFGDSGVPLILFPPEQSRYFDYKDFGVIESLSEPIEEGKLKVYCPDSFENKCWQNFELAPEERIKKYLSFEKTILQDILRFANYETESEKYLLSGFGRGAYYAVNTALKHPHLAAGLLSIAGEYDINKYLDGYHDDETYLNNPLVYMKGLIDEQYLSAFREFQIILSTGSLDSNFDENKYLSKQFFEKNVNHFFDAYPFKLNSFEDCKLILKNNLHYFL